MMNMRVDMQKYEHFRGREVQIIVLDVGKHEKSKKRFYLRKI